MDDTQRYLDSKGVKYLWDKAARMYVVKEEGKGLSQENFSTFDKEKLDGLYNFELFPATADDLGGIKIGAGLSIDEEGIVKTVYNPEMPVEWDLIEDKPSTVEGYGITDAATKDELEEVKTAVSKVYKYKGKVAKVSDLVNIQNPQNGDVYDVEEDGMNYAWNATEERWDNLGSIISIEGITAHELDIITGSADTEETLLELLADGGEVSLGDNMTITSPVVITKDTVLDMNNFKMDSEVNGYMITANNATLTIKNANVETTKRIGVAENGGEIIVEGGKFVSDNDVAFCALGEGSKITVNGGEIQGREGCLGAYDKGELEINGGFFKGIDNFPVYTNGTAGRGGNTITINGGEFEGHIESEGYEACCVYVANNDTVVINNGSFTSFGGCGILMRGGTVVINHADISVSSGDHTPGYVGDAKTKMNASAIIYHESANYPGKEGMSLTINDGNFFGEDHSLEVLSNEETPKVYINGGEFNPPYPEE